MYETISVSEAGPVGFIRLRRPEVRNAFNRQLIEELAAAAHALDGRSDIKVVAISGEGASFCAGFDLAQFAAMDPAEIREVVDAGRRMAQAIAAMRATTIAAVHGHCVGGGLVLMMACDFRYATASARIRLPEAELGFPFAWGGAAWLTREVGPLLAAELILTCREMSGDEARACGLVNAAVAESQLESVVHETARRLSARSALILQTTKAQIAAAKQALCPDTHAYSDAHALYSAMNDPESQRTRASYLARRGSVSEKSPDPLVQAGSNREK